MKKTYFCFLILLSLLLTSCGYHYPSEYDIGVIYTTEYYNKSEIIYLDTNWNELGKTKYPYANMSYGGFFNSLIQDNTLYLLPKGISQRLDCGKVCALNMTSGQIKEYDFGRVNIIDYYADNNYVYALSNLNNISYFDRMDKATNEITTLEFFEGDLDHITMIDNQLFAISLELESNKDKYVLYSFDITGNSFEKVCDLDITTSPAFIETYDGNIYIPTDNILYVYDTTKHTSHTITLPYGNAYNLNRKNNILYIGHTDIFNGKISHITSLDLINEEISEIMQYNGTILQMEIQDNNIYIRDYDKLLQYEVNAPQDTVLIHSYSLDNGGNYYPGSFFLKPATD